MKLRDLSYRYKIPISFMLVSVLVVLAVSTTLVVQTYQSARHDLVTNAESLGKSLARALTPMILRDDVWSAYETVITPLGAPAGEQALRGLVVLDTQGRIYVASNPRRFPALRDLATAGVGYNRLLNTVRLNGNDASQVVEDEEDPELFVAVPILTDGYRLGTLILIYSKTVFLSRFYGAMWRVLGITGALLVMLMPLGWYWGRRMAKPLLHLTECMDQVGSLPPDAIECNLDLGEDEIGHLGSRFKAMLAQLKEKQALETEMARANRLAAIGRIAAGIAHEVNNPLGGMLNAVSTLKRHGHPDPFTAKTVSLLERGLLQIKDIVGALLVEARLESHPLTPQDVEDTRTLMTADIRGKAIHFSWKNSLNEPVSLPSTLIRQILMNLLLNATQAVRENGRIECRVWRESGSLWLEVVNDGCHIGERQMEHLFEPFAETHEHGTGFGLWLVHQIILQLNGNIRVESVPGRTQFSVTLPLGGDHADQLETASLPY
ncbi:MAG: ATP-binding protein [Sulfuricaulis sp.]|uniref:sensor histidine kinase n=1 Tax=Sulfuricaulis sp. TaxID=2003553 RepID=UPI0034A2D025